MKTRYFCRAELVKDGVNGTLVTEPTPQGIALKLKETIENEDYYDNLIKNCKTEKDNILSVETYSDILIEKYQKLVEG